MIIATLEIETDSDDCKEHDAKKCASLWGVIYKGMGHFMSIFGQPIWGGNIDASLPFYDGITHHWPYVADQANAMCSFFFKYYHFLEIVAKLLTQI